MILNYNTKLASMHMVSLQDLKNIGTRQLINATRTAMQRSLRELRLVGCIVG